MGDSKEILERDRGNVWIDGDRRQYSKIQSVQNLETVINEGLRVALQ